MARPNPPRAARIPPMIPGVTSSTPVFGNVSFASPAAGAGAGLFSPWAALGAAATCVVGAAGVAGVVGVAGVAGVVGVTGVSLATTLNVTAYKLKCLTLSVTTLFSPLEN